MVKIGIVLLVSVFLLNCGKSTDVSQFANPVAGKCPVMGKDVNPSVTYTYEGKTYAFCCKMCVPKFKKDPDKYLGGEGHEEDGHDEHDGHSGHDH